jgi:hypothetical protein
MDLALFRRSASRANFDPGAGLYSDHMLNELLVLHEKMVAQLRLERLSSVGTTDFLTGMIAQHEKAAMMLRAQLENREAGSASDGLGHSARFSVLTGGAREDS